MTLLSIIALSFSLTIQKPISDTGIHHYYYMWSSDHFPDFNAWGEDDFDCAHYPTKKEISARVCRLFLRNALERKYLKIDEIVCFANEDAFMDWKLGQNSPQKAYQIYLHQ